MGRSAVNGLRVSPAQFLLILRKFGGARLDKTFSCGDCCGRTSPATTVALVKGCRGAHSNMKFLGVVVAIFAFRSDDQAGCIS